MVQHIRFATILLLVSFCSAAYANADRITLKKGMASKKLSVKTFFGSKKFHHNLTFRITNNTQKELSVDVDPGLIFVPDDTTCQNMVTLGSEKVVLAPGATEELVVNNFCGKSYARCPTPNMNFTFWKQGDTSMIKTLSFARTENINFDLIQHAVWMFTNGHCLSSVYSTYNPAQSEKFVNYIAKLKHKAIPESFSLLTCSFEPGQPVIRESGNRIVVPASWPNEGYRHMYVTVYKANGEVYKKINADWVTDKKGTTVLVEFNAKKDLSGTYRIEARDNNNKIWFDKRLLIDFENNCM